MVQDTLEKIFNYFVHNCLSHIKRVSLIILKVKESLNGHIKLKHQLQKVKKGELYLNTPSNSLNHALFVLNFLQLDISGRSAAQRFWNFDAQTCPGAENGNPLQYSCLEKPVDRGAWLTTVHGGTQNWTQWK